MDEYYALNNGLNPFSFNTDTCSSGKLIDCHPIVLTGMSFLAVVSVGYNLNELYQSFKQKNLRQGDSPLIGVISGLSENIIGAQVYNYYGPPQILTYVDSWGRPYKVFVGNAVGEYLHDFFVFHGSYQLYSNCLQMLKNNYNLVKSKPGLKIEKISSKKISSLQTTVSSKKDRGRPTYYQDTESDSVYPQSSLEKNSQEEATHLESEQPKKIKVKRRGIVDPSKMKTPENNLLLEAYETTVPQAIYGEREKGLDSIKDLRKFNAGKQTYINALLSDTCKFLDGRISPVDGNEYAIVFYRGSQKISLKYEIPHGADGNVYKAYKLKRVLNAMETAYMYNWDEHSILNYMATNNISRVQQIPHNLLYILWTRPDL